MGTIPKIIHYCWVGDAPKPQSVLYCIESWKKYCPDYEIREWNEKNYDFTKNEYMKQAYEAKKWGFVPDYARLDIIYEHGGVYLDTDVEIISGLDELLKEQAFMGFENTGNGEFFVNCGHGFGAVAHHPIIKVARDLYDHLRFYNLDGTLNMCPSPQYTTQVLKEFGLIQDNIDQNLPQMKIFASDVLCPKNFMTGKIKKSERTVSIHHFSASWLDEQIRNELEHQKKINNMFGKKLGHLCLVVESILNKYSTIELFTKLPVRVVQKVYQKLAVIIENMSYDIGIMMAKTTISKGKKIILLDTAEASDNCGDYIIMENCLMQLNKCFNLINAVHIPTHRFLTRDEKNILKESSMKILCGTNILSGDMRHYGLWKISADIAPYKNTILLGVGFDSENKLYTRYTKEFFKTILSSKYIHSVRDSFSEKKLHNMGVENVLNTGCPTMWGLTVEKCAKIPSIKAENVICTVTDYNRDLENDKLMFEILLRHYNNIYFWIQGRDDFDYLEKLGYVQKVHVIPSTLEAYDNILKKDNIDYIGTRLHAGIRAMSYGHRSIIIAVDNRARAIAKDTGLVIIERCNIDMQLSDKITSVFETKINMPWENIEKWKNQFK